jgi:hypothetical protein
MNIASKLIATGLALLLTPGLLFADPWQEELRSWRRYAEDFREHRDDDDDDDDDDREEYRERLEERRERAEEWREDRGRRAPLYVPHARNEIHIQPAPRYEIQPRSDRYRYERYERNGSRPFFVPPPPAPDARYERHGAYYAPRRTDDDDDIDAVYTPFGYYEEFPDADHRHGGRRPRAHGQIGPFRFEIWK